MVTKTGETVEVVALGEYLNHIDFAAQQMTLWYTLDNQLFKKPVLGKEPAERMADLGDIKESSNITRILVWDVDDGGHHMGIFGLAGWDYSLTVVSLSSFEVLAHVLLKEVRYKDGTAFDVGNTHYQVLVHEDANQITLTVPSERIAEIATGIRAPDFVSIDLREKSARRVGRGYPLASNGYEGGMLGIEESFPSNKIRFSVFDVSGEELGAFDGAVNFTTVAGSDKLALLRIKEDGSGEVEIMILKDGVWTTSETISVKRPSADPNDPFVVAELKWRWVQHEFPRPGIYDAARWLDSYYPRPGCSGGLLVSSLRTGRGIGCGRGRRCYLGRGHGMKLCGKAKLRRI